MCHFEFKCLKQFFNSCLKKHPESSQIPPITSITLNGLKIQHPALSILVEPRQKCEFCELTFKNLKAKPYFNILNKLHSGCI